MAIPVPREGGANDPPKVPPLDSHWDALKNFSAKYIEYNNVMFLLNTKHIWSIWWSRRAFLMAYTMVMR